MGAKLQFLAAVAGVAWGWWAAVAGVTWWFWAAVVPASVSSANVYRFEDFRTLCYTFYSQNATATAFSTLTCASACSSVGCGLFAFEEGVCAMSSVGTFPVQGGRMYVLIDPAVPRVKETLPVIGNPTFGANFWIKPADMVPALAADGNEDVLSYYHSHPDVVNPWWVVDLLICHLVTDVHVLHHGDGLHTPWFKSIEVRTSMDFDSSQYSDTSSDFSSWNLLGGFSGPPSTADPVVFSSSGGVFARYISIQRLATVEPYLILNEVKVYGYLHS